MNKKDIVIGFIIGIIACILGIFLFITFFTDFDFITGIESMKSEGKLGKLITLGAILDLVAFGILLKMNKDLMARGVVLAVIILAAVSKEWRLLTDHIGEVGFAVLSFNLISLGVGYLVPLFLKISHRQATAISMEVGIHNGTLALYMAMSVLGSTAYAVPAAVYSVVMYFTAFAFSWFLKKKNSGLLV